MRIIIENEDPKNVRSLFRVTADKAVVAQGLTAAQAHIVVGEILEGTLMPQTREVIGPLDRDALRLFLGFDPEALIR